MGLLKQTAILGHNYLKNGIGDYELWSLMMLHRFGPRIKPYLSEIRDFSQALADESSTSGKSQKNCWEYKDCGGSMNGVCQSAKDICPAFFETRLDGIHGGMNGGRACWMVEGTLCQERMPESFCERFDVCGECDFYQAVRGEQGADFMPIKELFPFVERRQYKRFLVKKGTYAVFQPASLIPCQVVDISPAGLSFHYVAGDARAKKAPTLDISLEDGQFHLREVPYEIISDFEVANELFLSPAKVRRCGVRFGKLLREQKSKLECFIRNHTRGENQISVCDTAETRKSVSGTKFKKTFYAFKRLFLTVCCSLFPCLSDWYGILCG